MAKEPVVLFNRSRFQSFQFTMYHAVACKAAGKCFCEQKPRTGADQRGETHRVETSYTILPREHTKPFPTEVLLIPQVKKAMEGTPPLLMHSNKLADVQVFEAQQPTASHLPRVRSSRAKKRR